MTTGKNQDVFPTPIFFDEHLVGSTDGLTKREYFAALALHGYLASCDENTFPSPELAATEAIKFADALINSLNQS